MQNDFVALEYIGAAYTMAARRLANRKRRIEHHKKLVKQEKNALQQACFTFRKAIAAYDYRNGWNHSTTVRENIDPLNYQIEYANDHQVLRSYGDALPGWEEEKSRSVFERGFT